MEIVIEKRENDENLGEELTHLSLVEWDNNNGFIWEYVFVFVFVFFYFQIRFHCDENREVASFGKVA
jgi:hypothetical protein